VVEQMVSSAGLRGVVQGGEAAEEAARHKARDSMKTLEYLSTKCWWTKCWFRSSRPHLVVWAAVRGLLTL
jgi:hypothetical protein